MATAKMLTKRQKFQAVWRLGREYFAGRITRQSFDEEVREIVTPEPELPLGIGAVMPERNISK